MKKSTWQIQGLSAWWTRLCLAHTGGYATLPVLELNQHVDTMYINFQLWSEDALALFDKDTILFPSVEIHKDAVFHTIFADDEDEDMVSMTKHWKHGPQKALKDVTSVYKSDITSFGPITQILE